MTQLRVNAPFQLRDIPPLSRSGVDRDEPMRDDVDRQRRLWPSARMLVVDRRSRAPVTASGDALLFRPATGFGDTPPDAAVLLGEHGGLAYWAVRGEAPEGAPRGADPWRPTGGSGGDAGQEQWLDLRAVGALLSEIDAGLLTTAVSVLYWHGHNAFCAVCGAATVPSRAGWARDCTGCGRQEYPRTDPAVIVLVHDGADRVLLARQPSWPEGRYSVLAGFVEAGEPLEGTVAREVHEEVGVRVRDIRYLGSQPWPFPRSLMCGFAAVADPTDPIVPADGEIESARWVHRDEVRAALAGGTAGELALPGGTSIAATMISSWALTDL